MNQRFITLVDQILAAKQQPPSSPFFKGELPVADTSALEKQIDEMVYALYVLTPDCDYGDYGGKKTGRHECRPYKT